VINKIVIEVIPHRDQRYNTVGDWQFTRDGLGSATELNIKVSEIGEAGESMLIAIHELVEAILCEFGGIEEKAVDEFDMNWLPRKAYWDSDVMISEPGEDDRAPYYTQHQTATGIERIVAMRLWTNWARYEARVDKLIKDNEEFFATKQDKVEGGEEPSPARIFNNPTSALEPLPEHPSTSRASTKFNDDIPF
jgi:hypothetical protein